MKREQISEIFPDATKEQIDKLMGINGTDINSAKGDLDGLKGQLATAQAELAKLKEASDSPKDALREASAAIKALQTELDTRRRLKRSGPCGRRSQRTKRSRPAC